MWIFSVIKNQSFMESATLGLLPGWVEFFYSADNPLLSWQKGRRRIPRKPRAASEDPLNSPWAGI